MGLGVNNALAYPNYFAMIPTGPDPNAALTEGFFELAAQQNPRPTPWRSGSPTSPMSPPGPGSSTSHSSWTLYSRAIVGWSAATSKRAKLVLDALDMAL
ncbi:hypothetical protein GCM10009780_75730 [Actinomadura alba]|uniref:hypothetical protein n=1 Tax=Actinomadura alba TaxID=406431 RepID=UPI001C9BD3B2